MTVFSSPWLWSAAAAAAVFLAACVVLLLLLSRRNLECRMLDQRLQDALAQARQRDGELDDLRRRLEEAAAGIAALEAENRRIAPLDNQLQQQLQRNEQMAAQLADCRQQAARLQTALEKERQAAEEKLAVLQQAQDRLKAEFENLANRIFEEKSARFDQHSRQALDGLLSPLKDQIGSFRQRIEDVYDKQTRDRATLMAEITRLKDLNERISQDAINLTRALKGDSKTQGTWGEIVLERVLEASGLTRGREYELQVSLEGEDGKRYRPDAVVHLPEGKDVIIDAKVSLRAYERYSTADDPQQRRQALDEHVAAVRAHLRDLSAKRYAQLKGVRTLDFILMFMPIEAAFLAAIDHDRELFAQAFADNIMLVSPSTLLVTLRTIQNIWRYEYQNRYALEIAKRAGQLYDKFVGFVQALEEVGAQLDKARAAWRTARDRLSEGRGNLVRRCEQLMDLGVKATKKLPADLVEKALDGGKEDAPAPEAPKDPC